MKFLTLNILQWTYDPTRYLILSAEALPFEDAPFFFQEWVIIATMTVYSPLYRPIPEHHDLYLAVNKQEFPYNTSTITKVPIFDTTGHGTFFIASNEQMRAILRLTQISGPDKYGAD